MEPARCSVRLCRSAAEGESPVTCQLLCSSHIQDDLSEIEVSEVKVAQRIQHFKKYQRPLRLMQQRLASDLQLLEDTFNELRETLDKCQGELIAAITKQHDQLMDSLITISELDDFEKELKRAKDEHNMRQAFLINRSMESSLRTLQLDSNLVRMDEESQEVQMAAYPDLNSTARELHVCVGTELMMLKQIVELVDVADSRLPNQFDLQADENAEVVKLRGNQWAVCLTVCNNTSGVVINETGSIVKADDSAGSPLPQPSIFAAVAVLDCGKSSKGSAEESDTASFVSEATEFKVLLLSADAEVTGSLPCSWNADQPIRDMHCDNGRQLLFIAQQHAVTVADLCGTLQQRISISDLQEAARKLYCITGNSDKLFALIEVDNEALAVVGISKDSFEVQMVLPVPDACRQSLITLAVRMAVWDRMLMVSDNKNIFTICTISSKLLSFRSVDEPWIFQGLPREDSFRFLSVAKESLISAACHLVPSIGSLTVVPISKTPLYALPTTDKSRCQFVEVKDGRVVVKTVRIATP